MGTPSIDISIQKSQKTKVAWKQAKKTEFHKSKLKQLSNEDTQIQPKIIENLAADSPVSFLLLPQGPPTS